MDTLSLDNVLAALSAPERLNNGDSRETALYLRSIAWSLAYIAQQMTRNPEAEAIARGTAWAMSETEYREQLDDEYQESLRQSCGHAWVDCTTGGIRAVYGEYDDNIRVGRRCALCGKIEMEGE